VKRRVFNLLVGISFSLCVATAILWIRVAWFGIGDGFDYKRANGPMVEIEFIADSNSPGLELYFKRNVNLNLTANPTRHGLRFPGFDYFADTGAGSYNGKLIVSHWLAMLATVIAPLALAGRWLQPHKSNNSNCCSNCGYDLRATPDRCPECGTVKPVVK
jgi:hypothetical protein